MDISVSAFKKSPSNLFLAEETSFDRSKKHPLCRFSLSQDFAFR